jgi:DNA-binding NarL/FixJ family response regulator
VNGFHPLTFLVGMNSELPLFSDKAQTSAMLRVVLVEDQVMFRSALTVMLETKMQAKVIGAYSSGYAFLDAQATLGEIDLILLDIQLPGEDGITLASRFATLLPKTKVILLSSVREEYILHKALQSGADGYVHKDDPIEALISAIESVSQGGCFFGQTVQQLRRQMGHDPNSFTKILTDKEQEVLELLGQGLSNEEAAPTLALSPETVQTHRRNIMRKLGLHSALQLQSYALKRGFTSVTELH